MSEIIEGFDLSRLVKRLVSEDGFQGENCALLAIEEYKKFFFLLADEDDSSPAVYLPSPIVELVWQRHMLDTLNYFKDCAKYGMPNGYCHRYELRRPCSVNNSSETFSPNSEAKTEDLRNISQFSADCTVQQHYSFTLQAYKKMYGTSPPAEVWPPLYDYEAILDKRKGAHLGVNEKYLSYAIPHADVLVSVSPASSFPVREKYILPQESELVSDLMWVGELVFDSLALKQSKCSKQEPLSQISFNDGNKGVYAERTVDELWHAHILCSPVYFKFW